MFLFFVQKVILLLFMPSCEHVKNVLLLSMSRVVQYEAIALEDQAFLAPIHKTPVAAFYLGCFIVYRRILPPSHPT